MSFYLCLISVKFIFVRHEVGNGGIFLNLKLGEIISQIVFQFKDLFTFASAFAQC